MNMCPSRSKVSFKALKPLFGRLRREVIFLIPWDSCGKGACQRVQKLYLITRSNSGQRSFLPNAYKLLNDQLSFYLNAAALDL